MKLKIDTHKLKRSNTPYILALLVLTLFYLFHFFNLNLPAHDITTAYSPLAELLKISAKEYGDFWPLWNPYGFSGTSHLMKPLLGLDSLLGVLILIVPNTVLAVKLTYVILFFISGVSMYSLAMYLKLERKFAFISALVYLLNGHMTKLFTWGWLTTIGGYSLLPLAFLFGIKSIKEKNWIRNSILTGVVFAILFRLNPDMKVTLWLGFLYGIYLLFNLLSKFSKQRVIKTILVGSLITLVFFGLSAQRIIPNAFFIKQTSRGETSWQIASGRQLHYSSAFNRLVEPLNKGLLKDASSGHGDHVGIVAFTLAALAIYWKRKNKAVIFFSLGALFSVLVATNTFGLYYLLWRFVPFFKSLRYMDRSLFLYAFCASVLAGIGAKEMFARIKKHRKQAYLLLVGLIILNLWTFNYSHYTWGNPKDWFNTNGAIENNHVLQNLSKTEGLFRIQTWETRGIDWGTDFYNVPLGLEHIYKYDPIWYPPYMNVYLAVSFRDPAKFWGILNLKYITAQSKINVSGFKFIKKFDNCTVCFPIIKEWSKAWGPYLYENELFLPRAYVVNNAILVVGEEDTVTQTIYALMLNKEFNPANTVIIRGRKSINDYKSEELAKYPAIFLTKGSVDQNSMFKLEQYVNSGGILLPDLTRDQNEVSEGDVNDLFNSFKGELKPIDDDNIIMHNFDKREIKLDGEKGFLVYSEKFSVFDGWHLSSPRAKKDMLNANVMNTAVYLEGNENTLYFEYKPASYIFGLYLTIITLIIIACYSIYAWRRNK